MNTAEIDRFLDANTKKIPTEKSMEKLYALFIELTVVKTELHKLIHFCIDDYERKEYFGRIDLANTLQVVCEKKIRNLQFERAEKMRLDAEAEKTRLENDLKRYKSVAIFFKKFCKELLTKKQFAQIDQLAKHCVTQNTTVSNYIQNHMFYQIDLNNGNEDAPEA